MAQETVLIDFQVDYTELTNAQEQLAKTGKVDAKGFQALQAAIDTTSKDTQGLIKTFKDVAGASVKMGKSVEDAFSSGIQDALNEAGVSVKEFGDALKKANVPAISIKKELLALKEAMARMKAEGKDTGKEFDDLRARAGKLADAVQDANAEIKNAGSDTRNIDNVVGSISALAGGYAAVQGVAALFGDESEELQKTLIKVNSAMAIAQGIQQVSNALQKEGALLKLRDAVATGAQTAATTLYTFVMGGATVATKLFRAALLATGIGAVVVLVASLVSEMSNYGNETEQAKEAQDRLRVSVDLMNESLDFQISRLKRLGEERIAQLESEGATDVTISQQRIKLINDEIKLLEQKEANSRKLADSEEKGSIEAQRLYKEANDFFYQQEALKSQIKIIGFNDDKKALEARLKLEKEFLEKRKKALEDANKEALAQARETDKNFILAAIERANKEIEQEQIAFDNKQDIEEQKREEIEKTKKVAIDAVAAAAAAGEAAGLKEVEDTKKAEDAKRAERIKTANQLIEIANQVGSIFSALGDLQTSRDTAMIAAQKKRIDEELKAGVITQKQAEAKQKALDKAEREARNRAAEREKKAAVFQAILAIPRAFLKGLDDGGIYLAAVYAALAAVEAGIIASKPVPRFFRGKKDRYEGLGEVADMGSEIVERGGRMFLYTKPTHTYLAATDKVYTAGETRQILHNTRINTTVRPAAQERFDYDRFAKAIPGSALHINIDKDGITEWTKGSLSRTTYMDKRYSSR